MATTPAIARAAAVKRSLKKAGAAGINVQTYKPEAAKVTFAEAADGKQAGAALRAAGYRTTPVKNGFIATVKQKAAA